MTTTEPTPRPGRRPPPRRPRELPLVFHAIGLKLAIELGDQEHARTEADALRAALTVAETRIPKLRPSTEPIP